MVKLCRGYDSGDDVNDQWLWAFYPHLKAAMTQHPESESSLKIWSCLMLRASGCAKALRNWSDAREMTSKSNKAMVKLLGAEYKNDITHYLAETGGQGKQEQTDDHHFVVKAYLMLADSYQQAQDLTKAADLGSRVVDLGKSKLGENHDLTLVS